MDHAPATRAQALVRLEDFRPRMGRAYAAGRNHDHGPGDRSNVSTLSPWIRRRLVLEQEVIAAALSAHSFEKTEKFVQEVVWRAYFKGWLEMRPRVWNDYRQSLPALRQSHDPIPAEQGRTGIACFDAWARELTETGYLHNHARMWFASIWIFTLSLPWQLGADFFLRHLLDGDPASNTCSWRWVAGLHTPGKTYAARSANITKFTDSRFPPVYGLAPDPVAIPGENPAPRPLRTPRAPDPALPTLHLITEEDCRAEDLVPNPVARATVQLTALRSDTPVNPHVAAFDRAALADAAARCGGAGAFDAPDPAAFADWAALTGARQIATHYLPVGWVRDWADLLVPELDRRGIAFAEVQRPYDAAFWPHATAGFFKVKQKIPATLRSLGIPG